MTKRSEQDVEVAQMSVFPAVHLPTRKRRFIVSATEAARMIGPIEPGCEICGLTNGQFSLIDIVQHILDSIGPAHMAVSTWTMGVYDQGRALAFYEDRRILSARWIVDRSFFGRKPELAGPLVAAFGAAAFRSCPTHAKFAVMHNDKFSVVVRSSMNLNPNDRIENFDISESRELAGFFLRLVDDIFRMEGDDRGEIRSRRFFEGLVVEAAKVAGRKAEDWSDVIGGMGELGDIPLMGEA